MIKNWLLSAILVTFFVQVKIPAGMSRSYDDVKAVFIMEDGFTIRLILKDDKIVYVPALFTIIEEK